MPKDRRVSLVKKRIQELTQVWFNRESLSIVGAEKRFLIYIRLVNTLT